MYIGGKYIHKAEDRDPALDRRVDQVSHRKTPNAGDKKLK